MTIKSIPRRRFLAATGATTAGALAGSHLAGSHSATAQIGAGRPPATPIVRSADTILRNGKIVTVDSAFTIAQSIAIAGDRIAAVGPNDAVAARAGPATRVVDLKGKTVVPGLNDGGGVEDLSDVRLGRRGHE